MGRETTYADAEQGESGILAINVADWDEEKQILGGFYGQNGGTWCGISKRGRVAFLVDVMPFDNVSRCELIPLAFLKGALTPEEFGNSVVAERVMYNGLAFHLVVGDIKSNSMVYIAKRHAQ
ncbi:unnamed protein product [Arabidopsis lyrata]|uniref:Predicted protein n=1 Tax=Arabidopsis lyrata subsp. lyrata TaxID=81972 RepID=D7KI88_ARALL|nr:predicted protein [Arabidopsis lyrata subsp. lyrata]CAH8252916.1 unnamed protein product [Arabidopsis lyrata]